MPAIARVAEPMDDSQSENSRVVTHFLSRRLLTSSLLGDILRIGKFNTGESKSIKIIKGQLVHTVLSIFGL
jgi:hypothetical protein